MDLPLLATKLFLPPARAGRVQRQRLLDRLDETLRPGVRLALISAPAGFGKTSLLAEWLHRRGEPAAWLSLDSGDNTSGLFLNYLVAALERVRPGLLPETGALLRAQTPAPGDSILTILVNEISTLDPASPLVLALDDAQFLQAPEVRAALSFLVEHLPPGARLVIATRADPALPLARMRARGEMIELRADDLRFTPAEAAEFMSRGMVSSLPAQALSELTNALETRTEGWIAGLQMAALALRGAGGLRGPGERQTGADPEIQLFLRSFTGSHRFVLDYLAEEVLARLPEETVSFLLRTSLLERFCAELCAETAGPHLGENIQVAEYQTWLEELERSNLFLVPLDAERRWFRYHHLFADLLRARLKQAFPQEISALHRRAAAWFERNDFLSEAIQHSLAAAGAAESTEQAEEDYTQTARMVEEHTIALFRRGELHQLLRWVNLLPAELADRRPWICVYRAWVLVFAGQTGGEVNALLQKAEASKRLAGDRLEELEGNIAAIRCHLGALRPGSVNIPLAAQEVASRLPEDAWARGVAEWSLGFLLRARGEFTHAAQIFERQLAIGQAQGDPWGVAMNATDLGLVRREQGRLREAQRVFESGLEFVESRGARRLGYTGRLLTALAAGLYEADRLDEAGRILEEAVSLNQLWRNPNHLVYAYLNLARLEIARRNFARAGQLLDQADQVLRDLPVIAKLEQSAGDLRLSLLLAEGHVPPPGGALEEQIQLALSGMDNPPNDLLEMRRVTQARVLLAQGRAEQAILLLEPIVSAARAAGHASLVEALALLALARHDDGKTGLALETLGEAVALAAPEGMVRSIIDAAPPAPAASGEPMPVTSTLAGLLAALRRKNPVLREYIEILLTALPSMAAEGTGGAAGAQPSQAGARMPSRELLGESLSERELEVLGLLADGLTNAQIAGKLVISTGTVKAHTANIFRKLDAANRTQAVSIARELGLFEK